MEGFSLAMALVDAIPVLFFGGSMLLIYRVFDSPIFLIGALLSLVAGCCKVLWKLILAIWKKDVKRLNKLFLPLQISGTTIMLIALAIGFRKIDFAGVLGAILSFPSCIFFIIGAAGMAGMGVIAKKFDNSAKANWTAQIVNAIAQCAIFLGVLFAVV